MKTQDFTDRMKRDPTFHIKSHIGSTWVSEVHYFDHNLLIKLDEFVNHPLNALQPIAAYIMLSAAIMTILGKLSYGWVSVLLKSMKLMFSILRKLHYFNIPSASYIQSIESSIPSTIGQVQKNLQLNPPKSTKYACCPNRLCSRIYPPSDVGTWPQICTGFHSDGEQCCTQLLRKNKTPIRPFVLYDIKTQIAELTCMEPTASQLRQKPVDPINGEMVDIFHGNLVRDFKGPVKGPGESFGFFDMPENESRLMLTLSVDWMNPFGVKAAGVSASVGVIAMCCANLPLSIRYKPENLILVGLIPGPHELVLDTINHFLKPIVDDFLIFWEQGIQLTGSLVQQHQNRIIRAVILSLVTDMPASKKIAGNLSHAANLFCSLCHLRKADMSNLDIDSWDQYKRTCKDHRSAGFAWRNALRADRKLLEKETGIRFTELFRLPYWDPTRQVAVDIMHNLFLGIIKRHYTTILGMSSLKGPPGGSHLYNQLDEQKVKRGRRILNSREDRPQEEALKRACNWADLYALAIETGVTLNPIRKDNTKATIADALEDWVRNSVLIFNQNDNKVWLAETRTNNLGCSGSHTLT